LLALDATVTVAVLPVPTVVGLNPTVTTQVPLTASGAVQVLVCENSAAFVPPSVMPLTVNGACPLFVNVTALAVALVFTVVAEKVTLPAGE
jgi:hypothetical protein